MSRLAARRRPDDSERLSKCLRGRDGQSPPRGAFTPAAERALPAPQPAASWFPEPAVEISPRAGAARARLDVPSKVVRLSTEGPKSPTPKERTPGLRPPGVRISSASPPPMATTRGIDSAAQSTPSRPSPDVARLPHSSTFLRRHHCSVPGLYDDIFGQSSTTVKYFCCIVLDTISPAAITRSGDASRRKRGIWSS
jgi:hypothetical protein